MSTLALQLDSGDFDVAMSGIAVLGPRLLNLRFTDSYLKNTIALVVKDHRRDEFVKRIEERNYRGLRVAPPRNIQGAKFVEAVLPGVEVVQIKSPREYFESGGDGADAIIWSAESGSAWTLLYPHFSVLPIRPITHIPVAYAVASREVDWPNISAAGSRSSRVRASMSCSMITGYSERPQCPRPHAGACYETC